MEKNAFITGITGGIGEGLIKPFLKRMYTVYGQYRNEKKRLELAQKYANADLQFVYSTLEDSTQLESYFVQHPRTYTCIVLAAGRPGLDDPEVSREQNIANFDKDNVENKRVFVKAFIKAYPTPPKERIKLVLICSHVAKLTDEEIQQKGFNNQIGYIYAMRSIYTFGQYIKEKYPEYFEVIIEMTDKVETKGLIGLREDLKKDGVVIDPGSDPETYGEELLTKIAA